MTEFLSCRPNLEVDDLAPAAAFLREVLGFEVEVDEPEMAWYCCGATRRVWAAQRPLGQVMPVCE